MSHFSRLCTKIKDKGILLRCLTELGYRVIEGGEIRGHQSTRTVEIAIRMPQGFDLGFALGPSGSYDLIADWWGTKGISREQFTRDLDEKFQEIQKEIEDMERQVRREYALQSTLKELQKQGFQVVERQVQSDGTVKILARRWR